MATREKSAMTEDEYMQWWNEQDDLWQQLRFGDHSDRMLSAKDVMILPYGSYHVGAGDCWGFTGAGVLTTAVEQIVLHEGPLIIRVSDCERCCKLGVYHGTLSERLEGWIDSQLSRLCRWLPGRYYSWWELHVWDNWHAIQRWTERRRLKHTDRDAWIG